MQVGCQGLLCLSQPSFVLLFWLLQVGVGACERTTIIDWQCHRISALQLFRHCIELSGILFKCCEYLYEHKVKVSRCYYTSTNPWGAQDNDMSTANVLTFAVQGNF
jgi:hypothetical protein